MKMKRMYGFLLLAAALTAATACESDGRGSGDPISEQARNAFETMFPEAVNPVWELKGDYAFVSFYLPETRAAETRNNRSAWFENASGEWGMTETDILYADLPEAVRTAFESGEYRTWEADEEAERLDREGAETLYVIEAEDPAPDTDREADLYYTADGTLVRTVFDDDSDDRGDCLPDVPDQSIQDYLNTRHPNARIIDIDREHNGTEVEIVDNGRVLELFFGPDGQWIHTRREVRRSEVPAPVMDALQQSEFGSWEIDDIEYWQTAEGDWYEFELESRDDREVTVRIAPDGQIL